MRLDTKKSPVLLLITSISLSGIMKTLIRSQTYDFKSTPALVATIRDLFELYPRLKALISITVRNEETVNCFLDACGTWHC